MLKSLFVFVRFDSAEPVRYPLAGWLFLVLLLSTPLSVLAQSSPVPDSIRQRLRLAKTDGERVRLLNRLAFQAAETNRDSARSYLNQGLALARRMGDKKAEFSLLRTSGYLFVQAGNEPQRALRDLFAAQRIAEDFKNDSLQTSVLTALGYFHTNQRDFQRAVNAYRQALSLLPGADTVSIVVNFVNLGRNYTELAQLDSARYFLQRALPLSVRTYPAAEPYILYCLGLVQDKAAQYAAALPYYRRSWRAAIRQRDAKAIREALMLLATGFSRLHQSDSSLYYARRAYGLTRTNPYSADMLTLSQVLAEAHERRGTLDSALFFQKQSSVIKDTLNNQTKARDVQSQLFKEQQRLQTLQEEQRAFENRVKIYGLLVGVLLLIGLAGVLWRSNRRRQAANALLEQQNNEIERQRDELTESLASLQRTQAQLIQKEKMASLGELTAGIAHEIQNPLNFVNNFSEVSAELVGELEEERQKSIPDSELEGELLGDLKQNLQKITLHGQRASSIVRGMLEHSRTSTDEKQPTDLNTLADEYLRLAYQGLRAKDKEFNAELKTDFDPNLGTVNVVPQELGRVLLNLFNNAFYAVSENKKQQPGGYQPIVSVRTNRVGNEVEITVNDNGTGMTEAVKAKIFQPFFTTKPTGQGTGLGLSLSYDIVIKGHGGTLTVESHEGEGTTFVVSLPR